MFESRSRMARERKTVTLMIKLYCKEQHRTKENLCEQCQELKEYAMLRLSKCPFQENKTTCGNCPIHCYQPKMRDKIREVMRFAGPRMIKHHPVLAIGHIMDGWKKEPGPMIRNRSNKT